MVASLNLGFPRIGADRELKKILEKFWKGEAEQDDVLTVAKAIREQNWKAQDAAGIDYIPCNDFSFYDQVLDHIVTFGAIPERYNALKDGNKMDLYFAMARGRQSDTVDVVAMEMTKWFDTNYHFIVPEFEENQEFNLFSNKAVEEFAEAKAVVGSKAFPVVLGPVTFLSLGKMRKSEKDPVDLLPKLMPAYIELLKKLQAAGATWVQIDEPMLTLDLSAAQKAAYKTAFAQIAEATSGLNIHLATYFEGLRDNAELAFSLPVQSINVDLVRAPDQLDTVLPLVKDDQFLTVGVVDGRNIWKNDYEASLELIKKAQAKLGDRVLVGPSCSLLHSPVDLSVEDKLDAEVKNWMAFATQKLDEIATLAQAASGADVAAKLAENKAAMESRRTSKRIHSDAVKERCGKVDDMLLNRQSPFAQRIEKQNAALGLPLLPTTTIGSFPQTKEIRAARAQFKKGDLSAADYQKFLEEQTVDCIRRQEEMDIDVLVHGEYERNDMVEYFGEQLEGFVFSKNGWVQSYGSRCVKPPIIFGDVSRPNAMTVDWAKFSQANTERVMKGMLTGPVTILQWSFVRNDQPRSETCKQIAFAIRDEVADLEAAGIKVIQIDEAALREGLPLRRTDWAAYLQWAVDSFRITASVAKDETQIHTHMCYSEFNDIIEAVAQMDADVISIETSRSAMELLDAFVSFNYPNHIGPGVYDIHSPRVPKQSEMEFLLSKALEVLEPEQVWVNPDCGLKTRGWAEVTPALKSMVDAAKNMRAKIEKGEITKKSA